LQAVGERSRQPLTWHGIPLLDIDAQSLFQLALERPTAVHFCNAWTLVSARRDPQLMRALTSPEALNVLDGAGAAAYAAWKLRRRVSPLRGPDAFRQGLLYFSNHGAKQALIGGSEGDEPTLSDSVSQAGASNYVILSPAHRPLDDNYHSDLAQFVSRTRSRVAWVGLGTPKQDIAAAALTPNTRVSTLCVGAAFDFLTGRVAEAPAWMHGRGVEWLYRLYKEPRRLWRRYVLGNTQFLLDSLRADGV
jgi:N-acetylglucosaminyldiphosphoundecaprenol N-acetyl-beta-D-mannosaminyltransferase